METIHLFKIAEDQKKFDVVEMLYDNLEECYLVRWKWATMKEVSQKKFVSIIDAKKFYKDRKDFALICN